MSIFAPPSITDFFDKRLLISWHLTQPEHLPPLENLTLRISADPPVEFEPNQQPEVIIPSLNGSRFIINWVIKRPVIKTLITLTVDHDSVSDMHTLVIEHNFE